MPSGDEPHLFHPEQVRTGERVARLEPPRPYWAGCALCGTSVDPAAPARRRLTRPGEPSWPTAEDRTRSAADAMLTAALTPAADSLRTEGVL